VKRELNMMKLLIARFHARHSRSARTLLYSGEIECDGRRENRIRLENSLHDIQKDTLQNIACKP